MSVLASSVCPAGSAPACSGEQYLSFPRKRPVPVICEGLGRDALGDAEVDDLGAQAPVHGPHHDVVGGEVPVHDALGVDLGKTGEHLARDVDRARRIERSVLAQPRLQRDAVDVLPDHVVRAVGLPREVVERRHVRVADEGRQARLFLEAAGRARLAGRIGLGDLDDPDLVEVDDAGRDRPRPCRLRRACRGSRTCRRGPVRRARRDAA